MKKIILVLIIIIVSVFAYATITRGFSISGVKILSLQDIKNKNNELDNKILELDTLKNKTYPTEMSNLSAAGKELISTKNEYLSLISYDENSEDQNISEYKKYEIEVLWVEIGNYATENSVKLNLSIAQSSNGTPDMSDIIFEGTGEYNSISDFISDIEKDDKLNFSIEEFELEPTGTQNERNRSILSFKFKVKDVPVNLDNIKIDNSSTSSNSTNSTQNNTNTTNTTNQ